MWIVLIVVYIAFIGLGMADSLLGPAWPAMNLDFQVPVGYAGIASFIFSAGKVIGCLTSDKLSRKYGEAIITGISTVFLAVGLFGISFFHNFYAMIAFCVPFGLGCGFLDVTVNSYVAVHYESRYNSWLHGIWGVGAVIGPLILGFFMGGRLGWSYGFLTTAICVAVSSLAVFASIKLWQRQVEVRVNGEVKKITAEHLPLFEVVKLPGVLVVLIFSFFYEGIQDSVMLWSGSFMVERGVSPDTAASFMSFLFIGITLSRFVSGFLTMKLSDKVLIRLGTVLMVAGLICFSFLGGMGCVVGLLLLGVGMAPLIPCMMHYTANKADPRYAPVIVTIQMAALFAGATICPPVVGFISGYAGIGSFGIFLAILLGVMAIFQERCFK